MKNYILTALLTLFINSVFAQIEVSQFNAAWNKSNEVVWIGKLSDCETISYIDIGTDVDSQKKHNVVVVPTIIIFNDNTEVKRYQADLSFKMVATKEEIQEEINNILMSDF